MIGSNEIITCKLYCSISNTRNVYQRSKETFKTVISLTIELFNPLRSISVPSGFSIVTVDWGAEKNVESIEIIDIYLLALPLLQKKKKTINARLITRYECSRILIVLV